MQELARITEEDKFLFMSKYFEMRLKDFLIQEYTRYGFRHTAKADITEAFDERNDQFKLIIGNLLFELGIPEPEEETPISPDVKNLAT